MRKRLRFPYGIPRAEVPAEPEPQPDTGPAYCNRCGIPHTTPCRRPEDT